MASIHCSEGKRRIRDEMLGGDSKRYSVAVQKTNAQMEGLPRFTHGSMTLLGDIVDDDE